jgi:hypothetical protein
MGGPLNLALALNILSTMTPSLSLKGENFLNSGSLSESLESDTDYADGQLSESYSDWASQIAPKCSEAECSLDDEPYSDS